MIRYEVSPNVSNEEMNRLFASAWENHTSRDLTTCLDEATQYWICAYDDNTLVGFVKVITDGEAHGFVLDTTTLKDYQRQGIGTELLERAHREAKERKLDWLHVDFEAAHESFYRSAGFLPTLAGLRRVNETD